MHEASAFEKIRRVAADQRRYFNALVDMFDVPQPREVIDRLSQVVVAVGVRPGEVVLDVGTGVGVLLPLIAAYQPSRLLACDVAEKMLQRTRKKYPAVRVCQADINSAPFATGTIDIIFMNAMYGNIADKPTACREAARMLRRGGRLVISHPEGRDFVDRLRAAGSLFIESLPARPEIERLLTSLEMEVIAYRDESKLYLMVARKVR